MKHIGLALIVVCLMSHLSIAKDVTLSWEPSPTPTVTGYLIVIGLNSSMTSLDQRSPLDTGNVLTQTILGLEDTYKHYFCVKAYDGQGNQSVCSNIVHSPAIVDDLPILDLHIDVEIIK